MGSNRLENGDRFPELAAPSVGDGEMTLPGDLDGSWSALVFYRGHW